MGSIGYFNAYFCIPFILSDTIAVQFVEAKYNHHYNHKHTDHGSKFKRRKHVKHSEYYDLGEKSSKPLEEFHNKASHRHDYGNDNTDYYYNYMTGQNGRLLAKLKAGAVGTLAAGLSSLGQRISDYGGDSFLGKVGELIKSASHNVFGHIKFILFTHKKRDIPQSLTVESIATTDFDKVEDLVFIIHGLTVQGYYNDVKDNLWQSFKIKNAFIDHGHKSNIVLVDWTSLSSTAGYFFSATATITCGQEIARFIEALTKGGWTKPSKVRIVGHSLGGQTAGVAGYRVKKLTGQSIAHIDGLDPAGMYFDGWNNLHNKLSPDDADVVCTILTDFAVLGTAENLGHGNFYPNGGKDQPGCDEKSILLREIEKEANKTKETKRVKRATLADYFSPAHSCCHQRVVDLYIESLGEHKRKGCKCDSWENFSNGKCDCTKHEQPYMGYYCDKTANGTYYLKAIINDGFAKYPSDHESFVLPKEDPKALPEGHDLLDAEEIADIKAEEEVEIAVDKVIFGNNSTKDSKPT